jgi:hypothetical protein
MAFEPNNAIRRFHFALVLCMTEGDMKVVVFCVVIGVLIHGKRMAFVSCNVIRRFHFNAVRCL